MVWRPLLPIALMLLALATAKARADDCRNMDAPGMSRVVSIDPHYFPRIGHVQYSQSLPLAEKEVVLTFDDGPLPPYTARILDVLAEQCVKANYFLVGRMARGYPNLVRRIHAEGHVIGTHSENHLLGFDRAPIDTVKSEIEQGIRSVGAALGNSHDIAPFFRIPGFLRRQEVEAYLQSRGLVTWSADVVADDWRHINASEVVRRAVARLDEKGKGILLLHDIQPATALALPELLRELKAKGYRFVQVVPGHGAAPAMVENTAQPIVTAAAQEKPAAATAPTMPSDADPAAEVPAPSEAPAPALSTEAANSLARGEDISHDPARPFTSGAKPWRSAASPGKFVTTEPGGWPPVIGVPVPRAGGVGVSPVPHAAQIPDGRFQ